MDTAVLLSETAVQGGFRICLIHDFSRDPPRIIVRGLEPRFLPTDQEVSPDPAQLSGDDPSYYVNVPSEIHAPDPAATRSPKRQRGRPRKPRQKAKTDKRLKRLSGPLTAQQRRDITDAVAYAASIGRPLTTTVDFHPARLDRQPAVPLDVFFQDSVIRSLSGWMARQKVKGKAVGWHAVATRENYEGTDREHMHLILHCPEALVPKLQEMLDRRFPGAGAVHVGMLEHNGLTYRLKQCRGDAVGPPRPGRPRPETHSRHDASPVAAVMGKRTFISRSIDRAARIKAGWQATRDEQRAVAKIKRLQTQGRD